MPGGGLGAAVVELAQAGVVAGASALEAVVVAERI